MPENSPAVTRPIELVTENGFSIVRLWEINREALPSAGSYNFMVSNPQCLEREITVEIADKLFLEIELKPWGRVLPASSLWLCCAERHLATYLWECADYPTVDRLCVDR